MRTCMCECRVCMCWVRVLWVCVCAGRKPREWELRVSQAAGPVCLEIFQVTEQGRGWGSMKGIHIWLAEPISWVLCKLYFSFWSNYLTQYFYNILKRQNICSNNSVFWSFTIVEIIWLSNNLHSNSRNLNTVLLDSFKDGSNFTKLLNLSYLVLYVAA